MSPDGYETTFEPSHPRVGNVEGNASARGAESIIEWARPVAFPADNIDAAPSFPSHVLPEVASNVVRAVSEFVEVDEGLVAQNILGIGSFPIARKVVVVEGAWLEETNLWTQAAADSGERKSATLRLVIKPIREVERERRSEEREEIADQEAALEMLEQQYAAKVKEAAKQTDEVERIAAETEVRDLARRLDEMRAGKTHRTRFVVDDVTPEFFGRELADNNPLLFANAEGGLLDNFLNRYSSIPNLDLLNQSYSGDDYSPGRSTRNAEPVERPLSCFALSPQPVVVAGLATNPILVARGTLSRWLYWFVKPRAGSRSVVTQPLDLEAIAAWDSRIRELLSLTDPGRDPYQVRMSDDAVAVMLPYRQHAEDRLRALDNGATKGWMNRARGQAQRLACVLHFLEYGVEGVTKEVEAHNATAAVALMGAYERHAEIAFDLMNEAPVIRRARTLIGWLRAKDATEKRVTVRQAHRAHQRWGTVKDFRDVLAELHGRGWIYMTSRDAGDFAVTPYLCDADDTDDSERVQQDRETRNTDDTDDEEATVT